MENNAPGRLKLKVTGILYIISAAISILGGLVALAGGAFAVAADDSMSGYGAAIGIVAGIVGVVVIVSAVYSLVMGILGVKNSNKPEKCGVNFVLGIIMIVFCAIALILGVTGDGDNTSSIVGQVISLVLAIIYTIGAQQNKDAVR